MLSLEKAAPAQVSPMQQMQVATRASWASGLVHKVLMGMVGTWPMHQGHVASGASGPVQGQAWAQTGAAGSVQQEQATRWAPQAWTLSLEAAVVVLVAPRQPFCSGLISCRQSA